MVETRLTDDGQTRVVELEVLPVVEPDTKSRCFLRAVPRAETEARDLAAQSPAHRHGRPKTSGGRSWSAS